MVIGNRHWALGIREQGTGISLFYLLEGLWLFEFDMNDIYIIITASLVATTCGLLGCFLILRKMAMVGDAISHAVLPGIVLAFLFSGSRDSVTMLIGAGVLGILTTFLIEFF